jgi:hypothetical protein
MQVNSGEVVGNSRNRPQVSRHQMQGGHNQFCEANDMAMPL